MFQKDSGESFHPYSIVNLTGCGIWMFCDAVLASCVTKLNLTREVLGVLCSFIKINQCTNPLMGDHSSSLALQYIVFFFFTVFCFIGQSFNSHITFTYHIPCAAGRLTLVGQKLPFFHPISNCVIIFCNIKFNHFEF